MTEVLETRSHKRRKRRFVRWAVWSITGFAAGIVVLLAVVYLWAGLTPLDFIGSERTYSNESCLENLHRLSAALAAYLESTDQYPPADVWMEELNRFQRHQMAEEDVWKMFMCPAARGKDAYGYAMNETLSEELPPLRSKVEEWKAAATTPVFFDSTDTSLNAHGGPELLPDPPRHPRGNNALFADGHAGAVTAGRFKP